MEKRHQITKIEKYQKEIKYLNIAIYSSVVTLTLALPTLALQLNSMHNVTTTILDSVIIPIASYNVLLSTKNWWIRKTKKFGRAKKSN